MTGAGSSAGLTRPQKAAVIIGVLGVEAAGPLLERLGEPALRSFTRAMASLDRIDPVEVRATIAEFLAEIEAHADGLSGGLARARGFLENHVAEGLLARILDEEAPAGPAQVWSRLTRIDDKALADFLAREHPQTAAVVLGRFDPEQAARIVGLMPGDDAREVIARLARATELDGRVVDQIAGAMGREVLARLSGAGPIRNPAGRAGEIMNYASPALRDRILAGIGDGEPELATRIRRAMFTVEDVPARVPKTAVAQVVRSLDQARLVTLLFSLRQSAPEVAAFLLSNISSRVAGQLGEEIAEVKAVKPKDAEAAQSELVRSIQTLAARGEITLNDLEDGEEAAPGAAPEGPGA